MTENAFEFEQRVRKRTLEIVGDVSPQYNIAPELELVRMAFRMGYEVFRPSNGKFIHSCSICGSEESDGKVKLYPIEMCWHCSERLAMHHDAIRKMFDVS